MSKLRIVAVTLLVIAFLVSCFFSYRGGYNSCARYYQSLPVHSDTTIVLDSQWFPKPVLVNVEVVDSFHFYLAELLQHQTDSLSHLVDSLYGQLQVAFTKESKRYHKDSLYTAWVSGYNPSLDSIKVYNSVKYITSTQKVPEYIRYQNSVYLSATALCIPTHSTSYFVPITLNYERQWKYGSLVAGVGFEPLTKSPVLEMKTKLTFDW